MTWVTAGVGVGTAVIGAVSSNKASKKAKSAQSQQMQMLQADLAFRRKIYEEEKAFRDPLRNKLRDEVMQEGSLDYGLKKANIETQYGNAAREMTEEAARSGTTGSNLESGRRVSLALSKAKTLSQAWAEGVGQRRAALAALMSSANPMAAAGGVSDATRGIAGAYGDIAAGHASSAAAGWNAVASGLGSALGAWQDYKGQQALQQQNNVAAVGKIGAAVEASRIAPGDIYTPPVSQLPYPKPLIGGGATWGRK
jgi:hypothetical protein